MIILLSALSTVLCLVGSVFASFGMPVQIHTAGKKEQLWGMPVPILPEIQKWRFRANAGWVMLGLAGVLVMWNFGICCWDFEFPWYIWLLPLAAALIPIFPATGKGRKWLDRTLARGDNALFLGELPILKAVDARVPNATAITLCSDGIFLYDARDYPFFAAYYRQFQLGDLSKESQLILLGYYFRQKYRDSFTCKPDTQGVYQTTVNGGSTDTRIIGAETKRILFERNRTARK